MLTNNTRYLASNGELDITTDRAVGQRLMNRSQTQIAPAIPGRRPTAARLVTIGFLLNSKAYSYMTRVGPDANAKRAMDASDILFILDYMVRKQITADRRENRWAVDYDF